MELVRPYSEEATKVLEAVIKTFSNFKNKTIRSGIICGEAKAAKQAAQNSTSSWRNEVQQVAKHLEEIFDLLNPQKKVQKKRQEEAPSLPGRIMQRAGSILIPIDGSIEIRYVSEEKEKSAATQQREKELAELTKKLNKQTAQLRQKFLRLKKEQLNIELKRQAALTEVMIKTAAQKKLLQEKEAQLIAERQALAQREGETNEVFEQREAMLRVKEEKLALKQRDLEESQTAAFLEIITTFEEQTAVLEEKEKQLVATEHAMGRELEELTQSTKAEIAKYRLEAEEAHKIVKEAIAARVAAEAKATKEEARAIQAEARIAEAEAQAQNAMRQKETAEKEAQLAIEKQRQEKEEIVKIVEVGKAAFQKLQQKFTEITLSFDASKLFHKVMKASQEGEIIFANAAATKAEEDWLGGQEKAEALEAAWTKVIELHQKILLEHTAELSKEEKKEITSEVEKAEVQKKSWLQKISFAKAKIAFVKAKILWSEFSMAATIFIQNPNEENLTAVLNARAAARTVIRVAASATARIAAYAITDAVFNVCAAADTIFNICAADAATLAAKYAANSTHSSTCKIGWSNETHAAVSAASAYKASAASAADAAVIAEASTFGTVWEEEAQWAVTAAQEAATFADAVIKFRQQQAGEALKNQQWGIMGWVK